MREQNNFHLIQKVQQSPESPTVVFAARFDVPSVRYGGRSVKIKQFDRRDTKKIREIFGFRKWDVRIEVGILDINATHHAFNPANDCSYGELLHALHARGYDPILPLKNREFIIHVERVLAMKILDANKRISAGSHHGVGEQLKSYARELRDYCRDYVRGGIAPGKPALSKRTIEIRTWRENSEPEFYTYSYGINEPLWETGQLEDAIDCRVIVYEGPREKISKGDAEAIEEYSRKRAKTREEKIKKEAAGRTTHDFDVQRSWADAKSRRRMAASVVASVIKPKKRNDEFERIRLKGGEVPILESDEFIW